MCAAQFAHRTNHAAEHSNPHERPCASPVTPATPSTIESIFVADHLNIEIIKKQKQQPAEFKKIKFKQKLSDAINDKLIRLAHSKSNK